MKKVIATEKAPKAIGPYSQAIQAGDFLFASGQIPLDPATGQLVTGSIQDEAKQVFENIKGLLESAGYSMQHVIKSLVFAADMNDFAAINEIYGQYFTENPPARSFVAVKGLPKGARIEVEVVAWKG